ncbi:MAG: glycosyltransferase family 1 protein [Moraxellaceae bacterium]|nr:MAG: glycosyltransferase family 1 protein [Moraxellaceae bacterium]
MSKPCVLILGKRGGILQWYEGLLAAQSGLPDLRLHGFAFNHNNWQERLFKKILKWAGQNTEAYTAGLLAKKIQQLQPDIILIADLFYLDDCILAVLKQSKPNTKIYHWIGDFFDARLAHSKDIVDCYLFTDSSFLDDAQKMGIQHVQYLPLAFNPLFFYPATPKLPRNNQLLFIGAWSENRQILLSQLDFPVTIYGKGWHKLKAEHITVHPHSISLQQVAALYRQYRYVLNIINRSNTRLGLNMRCFETMGAGATLITEYSSDLQRCFDINSDLIYFNNATELTAKMSSATAIDAQASCAKVHQHHTYAARIRTIIKQSMT